MKRWLCLLVFGLAMASYGAPRKIVLKVEKGADGKTHWMPEKVEVKPGEKVVFEAHYDAPKGAYDFHGLSIPVLKLTKEVTFGKVMDIPVTIPKDLKAGEYPIQCHLHETHQPATLVVK